MASNDLRPSFAVVTWLRKTGTVDRLHELKNDQIQVAIALSSLDNDEQSRGITDANESLLWGTHSVCSDGAIRTRSYLALLPFAVATIQGDE